MEFPNNGTHRHNPYKNYKFIVSWDGEQVLGVSKVSALKWTTEVVEYREGGDPSTPRKSPGQTKFDAITLERGLTHDPRFLQWANKVWHQNAQFGSQLSLADYKKTIRIELFNEAGQVVKAYNVFRCWVSELQTLPELDASGNATAIEMIKIENEGWEQDPDVGEPTEPSYTIPSP